jgi:hypothetical protein
MAGRRRQRGRREGGGNCGKCDSQSQGSVPSDIGEGSATNQRDGDKCREGVGDKVV